MLLFAVLLFRNALLHCGFTARFCTVLHCTVLGRPGKIKLIFYTPFNIFKREECNFHHLWFV